MHPDDQDVLEDFLLEAARTGISLKGQFLMRLIREAMGGAFSPNEQEAADAACAPAWIVDIFRRIAAQPKAAS